MHHPRWALGVALAGALCCGTLAQDEDKEVERLFGAAIHGRVVIRSQAANRLVALGALGEARILQELSEEGLGLAAMGPPIIEAIGLCQSAQLRAALWPALVDGDFPWRPSVARALAEKPRASETSGFAEHLTDPLAEVRAAMVKGFGGTQGDLDGLNTMLRDEDDRVRRAAALALLDRGQGRALWFLIEELKREDKFFERPTGMSARIMVSRALSKRGVDLGAYDCRLASTIKVNAEALQKLIQSQEGERPPMESWQIASGPVLGERIGLELRSCRAGEFFLRWTDTDQLLVGQGNAAVVTLPPGTTQRLVQDLTRGYDNLEGRRFFGAAGCDMEQVLLRRTPQAPSETLVIAKGPAFVPDLRPAHLTNAYGPLIATLPDQKSSDPRLHNLRSRAIAALAVLGGPLP